MQSRVEHDTMIHIIMFCLLLFMLYDTDIDSFTADTANMDIIISLIAGA